MKTINLNVEDVLLNEKELLDHLEKTSSNFSVKSKSDKNTYPIPRMQENFEVIRQVYNLLNENMKSKIPIHPAGEWLLDNFYIIEEVVKSIEKELSLKKYKNFVGISRRKISRICENLCFGFNYCKLYR